MGAHYFETPLYRTLKQELANCFCIKRQIITILNIGPYVFVATTQVSSCSTKTAIGNTSTDGYAYLPIKLYIH